MSSAMALFCASFKCGECLAEALLRFGFDPQQSRQDDLAIGALLRIRRADPFVDEIHDADGRGRGRGRRRE